MGATFTILLISYLAARIGANLFFMVWEDAHHVIGWLVFCGLFVGAGYLMVEAKVRGHSKVWVPRYEKIKKTVNSLSRRG